MIDSSPKHFSLAMFRRRSPDKSSTRRTAQENIRRLLTQIEASRKISRFEHLQLMTAILSNRAETAQDRRMINKIFEETQAGQLKIVDQEDLGLADGLDEVNIEQRIREA